MTRFAIASKARPEINLEAILGKHEFYVVSKSMFSADGMSLHCTDKYMLLSSLEDHVEYERTPPSPPPIESPSYFIIDAMETIY